MRTSSRISLSGRFPSSAGRCLRKKVRDSRNRKPLPPQNPPGKTVSVRSRKKKEETDGYRERFLVNIPASNRSHVYINREVAECIKRVLPVIAPDMSISGYISNILVDHIQRHWEEISELYNKEYYKPLKPF